MMYSKKELLSVRIDPTTLENIEKVVKEHYYWKRNTIISGVLDAVFDNFSPSDIYDMVRYSRLLHKKASGKFSLNDAALD
jgi:hypothetical protein